MTQDNPDDTENPLRLEMSQKPVIIERPNTDNTELGEIDEMLNSCIIGAMGRGYMYDEHKLKREINVLISKARIKAELYGRLHETIEAFQAGAIDADTYSKRHSTLTEQISQALNEIEE